MLTRKHAIAVYRSGRVYPDCLTRHKNEDHLRYAQEMLTVYQCGIGARREQLHRRVEAIFQGDYPIRRIRAFCHLLDQGGRFCRDSKGQIPDLRRCVFEKAAEIRTDAWANEEVLSIAQVQKQVADVFGQAWAQLRRRLYADVLSNQTLEAFPGDWQPSVFLGSYNLAQLQACLYDAESVRVEMGGHFKVILRYAKLAKLLHEVGHISANRYRLILTGPASLLQATRQYGICFAHFLSGLLTCSDWNLVAQVRTPWKGLVELCLDHRMGYTTCAKPVSLFDSSVEAIFADTFGQERDGWRLIREGVVLHERQYTFVPDFVCRHHDGTQVIVEIVGYWRPEYLERKRQTLKRFARYRILLIVQEKLLKSHAISWDGVVSYKKTICVAKVLEKLEQRRCQA